MSYTKYFELLDRMNRFILRKSTGTPAEFAARLSISKRKFFRMLDKLGDFGAIIVYDRTHHEYYYKNEEEAKKLLPFKE